MVLVVRRVARVFFAVSLAGCVSTGDHPNVASQQTTGSDSCPSLGHAQLPLPGTSAAERTLEYWLGRYGQETLDTPLMRPVDVAAYNADGPALGYVPPLAGDLRVIPAASVLRSEVSKRLSFMRDEIASGRLHAEQGRPAVDLSHFELEPSPPAEVELQAALSPLLMHCGPYPFALHKSAEDDLDRNACGMVRPQEIVQRLAPAENGMWFARTRYAMGFIAQDAPLSAALPQPLLAAFTVGEHAVAREATSMQARRGRTVQLPAHTSLPLAPRERMYLVTEAGVQSVARTEGWQPTKRPLTRRAVLTEAFSFIDEPYGWGGQGGGRDCSRLTMDLFASFGLSLPRYSGLQAMAGTTTEAVAENVGEAERVARIEEANRRGIVLLSFPGHIMLYLGLGDSGRPFALHSLGEYVRPCADGGETILNVRKVIISDLQLGEGSSRRSLLQRVDRITVLGDGTSAALATAPSGRRCRNRGAAQLFFSPVAPTVGSELRAIAVAEQEAGGDALTLFAPDGQAVARTTSSRFYGPPFARVLAHQPLQPGTYTAVLAEGSAEPLACATVRVQGPRRAARRRKGGTSPADDAVWTPTRAWTTHMESLWALFVESLFDYPAADETTWDNLHSLLRDRSRNLLHNHLNLDEDDRLELHPDCADLPYMLRAYFSWKMRLPFAYRVCNRGRKGHPPSCGALNGSLQALTPKAADPVQAFDRFASRGVRSGVHSASGRTGPDDSATDLYPVALTRRALIPGTVYADPYGHVMMLSKWYPQGSPQAGDYGILMASEAQPDGTIGRKRFWEGSFLFEPDTSDVGAGFKHFRPLRYTRDGQLEAVDNASLRNNPAGADYSTQQYGLTKDGFYEHMDALINPNPLKPSLRQAALIDALEESVRRRIESVDNAIQYFRGGGQRPIAMPRGASLFQTTGPWEDYSTPSRDMRLLISIDTVVRFPDRVAANPERYALEGKKASSAALKSQMEQELRRRTFTYQRSDGSAQQLSLWDVVARQKAFEMAYNPNDCVEVRWGAKPGSDEIATCEVRANGEQQARMDRYRLWFAERRRPQPGEG